MKDKMDIVIKGEYIELFKLLKFSGLAQDGTHAKMAIDNGDVLFNSEVELKKRKKVYVGDVVIWENTILLVKAAE